MVSCRRGYRIRTSPLFILPRRGRGTGEAGGGAPRTTSGTSEVSRNPTTAFGGPPPRSGEDEKGRMRTI